MLRVLLPGRALRCAEDVRWRRRGQRARRRDRGGTQSAKGVGRRPRGTRARWFVAGGGRKKEGTESDQGRESIRKAVGGECPPCPPPQGKVKRVGGNERRVKLRERKKQTQREREKEGEKKAPRPGSAVGVGKGKQRRGKGHGGEGAGKKEEGEEKRRGDRGVQRKVCQRRGTYQRGVRCPVGGMPGRNETRGAFFFLLRGWRQNVELKSIVDYDRRGVA